MNSIFIRKWTLQTIGATIILALVLWIGCEPVNGQVRITGAAGVITKPSLIGQFNVGYDARKIFASADVVRQAVKTGTWFGIKAGYIMSVNDQMNLRIYSGVQYKVVGNKHSYDRYVHNGQTEYLTKGLETNEINIPVGIQLTKGILFMDAGAMAGREITFMLTVGITHLFNSN